MARDTSFRQQFCSYLCLTGSALDAENTAIERLPSVHNTGYELKLGQAKLIICPPEKSPIHKWFAEICHGHLVFVQGEFYQQTDLEQLASCITEKGVDEAALTTFVAQLNGVFSGLIVEPEKNIHYGFTDRFGFGMQYRSRSETGIAISSHIWPLIDVMDKQRDLDLKAVQEILLFGYPLTDRSPYLHIKVNMPETIIVESNDEGRNIHYAPPAPTNPEKGNWPDYAKQLDDAFSAHCQSINAAAPNLVSKLALSGGHDSRVVLNAMLANDVTPECFTGYAGKNSTDDNRAMKVARSANIEPTRFDYSISNELDVIDCNILSDGSDAGTWSMNLSRKSNEDSSVIYFGSTGDLLSGGWHVIPHHYADLDELAKGILYANYEYSAPLDAFERIFPNLENNELNTRYRNTFSSEYSNDLPIAYMQQRIGSRNFRRIRMFMQGSYLHSTPVHMFHDTRVNAAFRSLPYYWLDHQRAQVKLCYATVASHAWIPATPYPVPVIAEPGILRVVQNTAKAILKPIVQKIKRKRPKKSVSAARNEGFATVRDNAAKLGIDPVALDNFSSQIDNPGMLAMRATYIANMLNPENLMSKSSLIGPKKLTPK